MSYLYSIFLNDLDIKDTIHDTIQDRVSGIRINDGVL